MNPGGYCGGDINFQIACLWHRFVKAKGMSYATANEFIGALECAKLEIYRRVVAPHEDTKIEQNGDVFDNVSVQRNRDGW